MVLACLLTVWAGANMWSSVLGWQTIWVEDVSSRSLGLLFSIGFTLLPLVIAIYLFWSVVVGPQDPRYRDRGTKPGPRSGRQR